MNTNANRLYDLLPAVYRLRDADTTRVPNHGRTCPMRSSGKRSGPSSPMSFIDLSVKPRGSRPDWQRVGSAARSESVV